VSKIRIAFLGSPDFAATALAALLKDEHYEIVGVVTQPDRPAGRKMVLTPTAVKVLALTNNLKVISPESVNQKLILDEIRLWNAEIAIVVAFGQILSQNFLDLFRFGAVNIHGSILPRWRGAAPIQRALEAGDVESGVTLQKIVKELDAGDIIGIRRMALSQNTTAKELYEDLAYKGAELLHVELMDFLRGNLAPVPQDHSQVTFAKKINKQESELKWDLPASILHNRVRAFNMGPGTWVSFQGKKLKIHLTQISDLSFDGESSGLKPGLISAFDINQGILEIQTSDGRLRLLEVQPESRNRMKIKDFLNTLTAGDYKKGAPFA
jgi:methionyl-tRNA formyltransferase